MPGESEIDEIVEEEVHVAYLSRELERITNEYDAKSKQHIKSNLTKIEKEGLRKLQKREDIVIFQTDKSARFSVDSKPNYVKACEEHTSNDPTITEDNYAKLVNEINAHSTMWCKILKAGEETSKNGIQRVKENMISSTQCDPPPLYALRKGHKKANR